MEQLKCVTGCKRFTGGEIKHHKDCPHYPDSMSQMYDNLKNEVKMFKLNVDQISLLDKIQKIAFGDGSAQERIVEIKDLFINKA